MSEKLYYKIGDVAHKFDVNASSLRYWESEFDFISPRKNKKGTRYYSQKDIDNISVVYYLIKEKGMTITGVKDYLAKKKNNSTEEELNVISTLKKTKELLIDIKKILEERS